MSLDQSNLSSPGFRIEAKMQGKETKRQMVAVFERFFKYFTVLTVSGVALAALRIRETGLLVSYPVQWFCALGMVLVVLMRGKIPYRYRVVSFGACGLIYSAAGIFSHGILGQGLLILLFVCMLVTIGGQTLHGYIVACLSTILTITAGVAFHQGWLAVTVNPASYIVSLGPWMTASVTILVLSLYAAMFLGKVKELWLENIRRSELSEANYRLLAENTTDVIWRIDLDTRRFRYVSPAIQKIQGYTPEEAMALPLEKILSPESLERLLKILQEELTKEGKEGVDPKRFRITEAQTIRKDGTYGWIEVNMNFIRDSKGRPVGVLGVSRDISERKQAEEEKKKLEGQLVQVQKMEAIGTLAGGIAHDFNNILSAIIGYTELSKMSLAEGNHVSGYLEETLKAGNRAKDLVQQILTFSRQTEPEFKPVPVNVIVNETVKLIRASLHSTIDVRQSIKSDSLVMGDQTQIYQIIMNLCANAGHAMQEKGGILEVDLTDVKLDSDLASRYPDLNPGTYINLTVSDTGHGIPPDVLDRVFDPFFTTKERGEGTGMGLAVVHGIVRSYGGSIYIYSEPGKGSSFKIFLPRVESSIDQDKIIEELIPKGTERILFVDDEPALVELGEQILKRLGYQVVTRTSSIDALELFRAQPERFDLVITDKTMPHMTGDKLAGELIAIRKGIPVILCTGFSHRIAEEKAKEMGVKRFLKKPLVLQDLANSVREVLDEN